MQTNEQSDPYKYEGQDDDGEPCGGPVVWPSHVETDEERLEAAQVAAVIETVTAIGGLFRIWDTGTESVTEFTLTTRSNQKIAVTSNDVSNYRLYKEMKPITLEQVLSTCHRHQNWKLVTSPVG